jgi:hypothetical protein
MTRDMYRTCQHIRHIGPDMYTKAEFSIHVGLYGGPA